MNAVDTLDTTKEHQTADNTSAPVDALVSPVEISDPMIAAIIKRLEIGKPVKRHLPSGAYLHLDRQVPFLLIYRRPVKDDYYKTEQLLKGETSYLILDGRRRFTKSNTALIAAISTSLAESFGAFLLIEIWADTSEGAEKLVPNFRPAFHVFTETNDALGSTTQSLRKGLSRITVQKSLPSVEITETRKPWKPGQSRLIPAHLAKSISCYSMGIGIRPIYQNPDTDEEFPLIQRILHRGLGRAIRRTVYKFTRDQTTQRPPHFHSLGPRSLVKLVWSVDQELAEIANDFDFLLSVTPINAERAWNSFKRSHFTATPRFIYRPLPVDPALVKRILYRIPIEKIEDPALEALFRAQQLELERKLTMLSDRGTRKFLYGSLQLYGKVDDNLLNTAKTILESLPVKRHNKTKLQQMDAKSFAVLAEEEIKYYKAQNSKVWGRVEIRDDVVGVLVSQGNLLINRRLKIPEDRVNALLAHEIGTHVLTYFNGHLQPFRQLYTGLPDYEELQEGLAVLAEYLTGGLTRSRLRLLAARVVAAHMIIDGAEFSEVFRVLNHDYDFTQRTSFNVTLRIFRGGGLLKDMVYLRGLIHLLEYLGSGGEFEPLLLGKFGTDHLNIIRELQWRKVLSQPHLKPRYLEDPEAVSQLEYIRQGVTLDDLLKRI